MLKISGKVRVNICPNESLLHSAYFTIYKKGSLEAATYLNTTRFV